MSMRPLPTELMVITTMQRRLSRMACLVTASARSGAKRRTAMPTKRGVKRNRAMSRTMRSKGKTKPAGSASEASRPSRKGTVSRHRRVVVVVTAMDRATWPRPR